MLLSDYWAYRYLPYCERTLRECTLVGYESAWRLHIEPTLGRMDMADITVERVETWAASAGSRTVKLVAGESGDWPTGTEIYLSGQYVAV